MTATDLTPMNLFYISLCNGLSEMGYSECSLKYSKDEYQQAKQAILDDTKASNVCFEDVLKKMLEMGFSLKIEDDMDFPTLTKDSIEKTFDELYMSKNPSFLRILVAFIQQNDDSITAWDFIQLMAYKEVIYG